MFHMMGSYSYLLDANFDDKNQLEEWIAYIKGLKLDSGFPAVLGVQTHKNIQVNKNKTGFSLEDYLKLGEKSHFFLYADNKGAGSDLIDVVNEEADVHSMLHIQGAHSFVLEVITSTYEQYVALLKKVKMLNSVQHVETHEVIAVKKYRNHVMDESGKLVIPQDDIREMFTL
jgi:hypothetical protein